MGEKKYLYKRSCGNLATRLCENIGQRKLGCRERGEEGLVSVQSLVGLCYVVYIHEDDNYATQCTTLYTPCLQTFIQ